MDYIYCAGEQGRVAADILKRCDHPEPIVFLDDDPSKQDDTVAGHDVAGGSEVLEDANPGTDRCLIAFGTQTMRLEIAEMVRSHGIPLFSAIDPEATICDRAEIGDGCIVNAGTYVGPDATLDELVLLDSLVNVSHDVNLRNGVTIGPNATIAGAVTVGRDAYVGAGATIIDHLTVGEGAVIGAGAVVVDDVPAGETVVGVPASPIE